MAFAQKEVVNANHLALSGTFHMVRIRQQTVFQRDEKEMAQTGPMRRSEAKQAINAQAMPRPGAMEPSSLTLALLYRFKLLIQRRYAPCVL